MLTIFANFRIDDEARFQHLKDSFASFREISHDWLINVRGRLRHEVIDFLRLHLGTEMILFELLDEDKWFPNSLQMIHQAKHEYILHWIEDHISIAPPGIYAKIVQEMAAEQADYLLYSAWFAGQYRRQFEVAGLKRHEFIDSVFLDKPTWKAQLKKGGGRYLIASTGIFRKGFIIKLLSQNHRRLPRLVTTNLFRFLIILDKLGIRLNHRRVFDWFNRWLPYKLTKFPVGPFDLEKSPFRWDVLPLRLALPRQELFACIDDDIGQGGYQLIKRGLYPLKPEMKMRQPERITHDWGWEEILEKNNFYIVRKFHLKLNQKYVKIYCQNDDRIKNLPRETIVNIGGELLLKYRGEQEVRLKRGEVVSIYPNIPHELLAADDDSLFLSIISTATDN